MPMASVIPTYDDVLPSAMRKMWLVTMSVAFFTSRKITDRW
jgi:hypothetical protein